MACLDAKVLLDKVSAGFANLDLSIVGRAFGVPIRAIGDLLDSASKDGKSGVPGGVRSQS